MNAFYITMQITETAKQNIFSQVIKIQSGFT